MLPILKRDIAQEGRLVVVVAQAIRLLLMLLGSLLKSTSITRLLDLHRARASTTIASRVVSLQLYIGLGCSRLSKLDEARIIERELECEAQGVFD